MRILEKTDPTSLQSLYLSAFPANERKPWDMLLQLKDQGKATLYGLEEEGKEVGLLFTLNGPSCTLIDYFALYPQYRNQRLGSKALSCFLASHPETAALEIELPDAQDPDTLRRKAFYEKNGMKTMSYKIILFGVPMEVMSCHGELSFPDYVGLLCTTTWPGAKDHIQREEPA